MTALEGKLLLDHGKTIARRYARRVGPELAEELRAEAVLRVLGSPPPDGRMEPWLERIYRNLVVDCWRRGRVRAFAVESLAHLSGSSNPEEDVLRHERRRVVRDSLNRLPREARRALLSRFYGELDDDVAATRLGIAPVTVRTRIHRGLARLRERLGDLRAWYPPLLSKLGVQTTAVGLAPVLVAALIVAGASSRPPVSASKAAVTAVPVWRQPRAHVAQDGQAEPTAVLATTDTSVRVAKPSVAIAAPVVVRQRPAVVAQEPVAMATTNGFPAAAAPLSEILHPEALDVFAEPARPNAPCMVEAPPSLLVEIDKMLEEHL